MESSASQSISTGNPNPGIKAREDRRAEQSGAEQARPGAFSAPEEAPGEIETPRPLRSAPGQAMAAVIEFERLQRVLELHCSCCLQFFAEPVRLTGCGHTFCRGCILRYCAGRPRAACPLCRRGFELRHLRPNRELAALLSLIPRELKEKLETQDGPEPCGAAACNDQSSAGRGPGEKVRPEAARGSIPRHPGASPPDIPGLYPATARGSSPRHPGTFRDDIPGLHPLTRRDSCPRHSGTALSGTLGTARVPVPRHPQCSPGLHPTPSYSIPRHRNTLSRWVQLMQCLGLIGGV